MSGMEMLLNQLMKSLGVKPEAFMEFATSLKDAVAHFEEKQRVIANSLERVEAAIGENLRVSYTILEKVSGDVLSKDVHAEYAAAGLLDFTCKPEYASEDERTFDNGR